MDAIAVISECESRGLTLRPDGDALVVRPSALLDDELRAAIRTNKAEVLTRLRDREGLLIWARGLARRCLILGSPITFRESPLVPVTTVRVSYYAMRYLSTIATAQTAQETGGWGRFDAAWQQGRERDASAALQSLREALTGGCEAEQ